MSRKALLILAVLVALFVGILALPSSRYAVDRSERIAAPPAVVFALVSDVSRWKEWWALEDAEPKAEGPTTGAGAKLTWSGEKAGEGSVTVLESRAPEHVAAAVEYRRPQALSYRVDLDVTQVSEAVLVTWKATGTDDFAGKAFALVMDRKHLVGRDGERALAKLKALAEAEAAKAAPPLPQALDGGAEAAPVDGGVAAAAADAGTP